MKMKLRKTLCAALITASLFTQVPSFAAGLNSQGVLPKPQNEQRMIGILPVEKTIEGYIRYNDLEGGFYSMNEYILIGDFDFSKFLGKSMAITGVVDTNIVTIFGWGKGIVFVRSIKEVAATKTFKGVVRYNNLEGGFYTLGKYILSGNFDFKKYVGKNVVINGELKTDVVSFYMWGDGFIYVKTIKEVSTGLSLFEHCDFKGKGASFGVGACDILDLKKNGIENDIVSSLKVEAGYKVTLFEHANFKGRAISFTANDTNLVDNKFNDIVSSIRVEKISK